MKKTKILYYLGIIVGITVILGVFILLSLKNKSNDQTKISAQNTLEEQQQVSISNDKKVDDLEKQEFNVISEIKKEDNNEQKLSAEKLKNENRNNYNEKDNQENIKVTNEKNNLEEKIIKFINPVEGDIIRDYAKDKLVYSDTLKEWITHLGIDIKSPKTSIVKASASGKIKAIKNDPRFGLSVVIEHSEEYSTVYSNLYTAEFVNVGENIEQGETIGTVGNTAAFEILDEPHLHFEILKNGAQVDPNMYL